MASDKSSGGEVEDQATIHLLVEVEVEVIEGFLRVAKLGLFFPSLQRRSPRRVSSSETKQEIRSIGAMASACAWRRRVSSTAAIPPSRSCRRARFNSMRFILFAPGF